MFKWACTNCQLQNVLMLKEMWCPQGRWNYSTLKWFFKIISKSSCNSSSFITKITQHSHSVLIFLTVHSISQIKTNSTFTAVSWLLCASAANIRVIFRHFPPRHHILWFCKKDWFPWKLPPGDRSFRLPRTTLATTRPRHPWSPWQIFP